MSEQENIQITRKLFDALNSHDLRAADEYYADNLQSVGTGITTPLNREKNRQFTQGYIDAFPDLHFTVKQIVAQGNWVAATYEGKGKHEGPLVTPTGDRIPPTHRTVTIPAVVVLEFRNDRVVRQEDYWDMVSMLMQLGLVTDLSQISRTMR